MGYMKIREKLNVISKILFDIYCSFFFSENFADSVWKLS